LSVLQNPTAVAGLAIGTGFVLLGWLVARAIKRFARSLTEMARAMNTFSATLDDQNKTATAVAGIQGDLEQLWPLVNGMDDFLRTHGASIQLLPGIDTYLRHEDGDKYLAAMAGHPVAAEQPAPGPAAPEAGVQEVPAHAGPAQVTQHFSATPLLPAPGPNAKYPKLPFDPENQESITAYMGSFLPEGANLEDALPPEVAQTFGSGYTWKDWARAQVNIQCAAVFDEYGLPPLGSDLTTQFRRVQPPTTS